jgi:hypothetical protein
MMPRTGYRYPTRIGWPTPQHRGVVRVDAGSARATSSRSNAIATTKNGSASANTSGRVAGDPVVSGGCIVQKRGRAMRKVARERRRPIFRTDDHRELCTPYGPAIGKTHCQLFGKTSEPWPARSGTARAAQRRIRARERPPAGISTFQRYCDTAAGCQRL